jgi:hypothetical protein
MFGACYHPFLYFQLAETKVNGRTPHYHSAGPGYTSLMVCFLLHNTVSAKTLLNLRKTFGNEWFPITAGFAIVRTMFEVDVTAHYIAQSPVERSQQYIDFEHVLNKRKMDIYDKHRNSNNPQWRESMDFAWQEYGLSKQAKINSEYKAVRHNFETVNKKGKATPFQNWSGKSIRQMAIDVNHEEAYDVMYTELSSYTHVDVRLANKFLRIESDGLSWSQGSREFDVGNVFRDAATFLTCFLELFANQFNVWNKDDLDTCWNIGKMVSKES